eukprot:scaffold53597_cov63-Phaeocystis_antarctica.AAC.2
MTPGSESAERVQSYSAEVRDITTQHRGKCIRPHPLVPPPAGVLQSAPSRAGFSTGTNSLHSKPNPPPPASRHHPISRQALHKAPPAGYPTALSRWLWPATAPLASVVSQRARRARRGACPRRVASHRGVLALALTAVAARRRRRPRRRPRRPRRRSRTSGAPRGRSDADAVVAAHEGDARQGVGLVRVVGEARLAALGAGVDHLLVVDVEEVARGAPVVHLAAPVGLLLRDELANVLDDERPLQDNVASEEAPAGDLARAGEHARLPPQLQAHVAALGARVGSLLGRRARDHRTAAAAAATEQLAGAAARLRRRGVARSALGQALRAVVGAELLGRAVAHVGVALAPREEAVADIGTAVALLALAAGPAVLAARPAAAEALAKVLAGDAHAVRVGRVARPLMVTSHHEAVPLLVLGQCLAQPQRRHGCTLPAEGQGLRRGQLRRAVGCRLRLAGRALRRRRRRGRGRRAPRRIRPAVERRPSSHEGLTRRVVGRGVGARLEGGHADEYGVGLRRGGLHRRLEAAAAAATDLTGPRRRSGTRSLAGTGAPCRCDVLRRSGPCRERTELGRPSPAPRRRDGIPQVRRNVLLEEVGDLSAAVVRRGRRTRQRLARAVQRAAVAEAAAAEEVAQHIALGARLVRRPRRRRTEGEAAGRGRPLDVSRGAALRHRRAHAVRAARARPVRGAAAVVERDGVRAADGALVVAKHRPIGERPVCHRVVGAHSDEGRRAGQRLHPGQRALRLGLLPARPPVRTLAVAVAVVLVSL